MGESMGKKIFIMVLMILILVTPVFAKWTEKDVMAHKEATFYIWTDEEYGVQYVVCQGYRGDVSICPRYTPKGVLVYEPVKW